MPDPQIITCEFSLFDQGRTYTGHHRKYVLENAMAISVDPEIRERIRLRECLGFYGHGRRVMAKKMRIGEVETVKLPDGTTIVVNNIPSNVTRALDIRSDGTIYHQQEVLDSEPGRIVAQLHASKIGGFSWACPGADGGRVKPTSLTGFEGFDYVHAPGFSGNRGYVTESAEGAAVTQDQILECVSRVVGDDKKAEEYLKAWQADAILEAADLRERLISADAGVADTLAALDMKTAEFEALTAQERAAVLRAQETEARLNGLVTLIAESAPFFIPDDVMHAMMEGDFAKARGIFESAERIDFSQFPIGKPRKGAPKEAPNAKPAEDKTWGSIGRAWDL